MGFEGEVRYEIEGLPEGYEVTNPLVIEAGQKSALGVVWAPLDAKKPEGEGGLVKAKVWAVATLRGEEVRRAAGELEVGLGKKAKLRVVMRGRRL